MHIHNFNYQTGTGAKMSVFLELTIVLLCMLIIKKKDILFLGGSLAQGLHDTTITAEAKYSINFTESGRRFVLSPY